MPDWANELKRIREEKGKSQSEMAEIVGIPQRSWSNYEAGRTEPPVKVLMALAQNGYKIKGFPTGLIEDAAAAEGFSPDEVIRGIKLLKRLNLHPDMPVEEAGRIVRAVQKAEAGLSPMPIYAPSDVPSGSFVIPLLDQRLSAGPGATLPEHDDDTEEAEVKINVSIAGNDLGLRTMRLDNDPARSENHNAPTMHLHYDSDTKQALESTNLAGHPVVVEREDSGEYRLRVL